MNYKARLNRLAYFFNIIFILCTIKDLVTYIFVVNNFVLQNKIFIFAL